MNIPKRIEKIRKLQDIKTPWEIRRLGIEFSIQGEDISITAHEYGDFLTLEEFTRSLKTMVEMFGYKMVKEIEDDK